MPGSSAPWPVLPPALRPGDVVALVPTARAIVEAEVADGVALLESWGLRAKLSPGIGRKDFQQAGTAAERAADLQAAIADPEVKAIWCARGGYGTMQFLERLDLSPLRKRPKWIVGFSDITALHNALHRIGLASLHAQMPHMVAAKTEATHRTLHAALFGEAYDVGTNAGGTTAGGPPFREGMAEGLVVGGNLSLLYALRGTPYDIDPRGKILFLEDLDELLYHLDRMVMNLRLSGWFEGLAGLVVGGMHDMHDKNPADPFGRTAERIITDALGTTPYPVCYGFPAGHQADNRALVLGARTKLSVTRDGATLSFEGSIKT